MATFGQGILSKSVFQTTSENVTQVLLEMRLKPPHERRETIRNYQIDAVFKTKDHFAKEGENPLWALIVASTGAGKSGMIVMLPYVLASAKVVILSPSVCISDQLALAFGKRSPNENNQWTYEKAFFYERNVCRDEKILVNCLEKITVITKTSDVIDMAQKNLVIVNAHKFGGKSRMSLMDKRNKIVIENVIDVFKNFDTIIVDEAHHYPAPTWDAIIQNFTGKKIVFLTATPSRSDGYSILKFGKGVKVFEITREDLEAIPAIRKSTFIEHTLTDSSDLGKQKQISHDIKQILEEQDIQNTSVKHQAMVLVDEKKVAEATAKYLSDNGVTARYYTSDNKTKLNKWKFDKGQIDALVVCGMLKEGYDNSKVSLCVILRRVCSKIDFSQFIGRSVRLSSPTDGTVAVVLSYTAYDQKRMWDSRDDFAEEDPTEDNIIQAAEENPRE